VEGLIKDFKKNWSDFQDEWNEEMWIIYNQIRSKDKPLTCYDYKSEVT
jgi:hypothetical protein